MSMDFSQPFNPLLWGGIDQTSIEPPAPLHWRTFRLPKSDPDVQLYGEDGVVGWELKIDDLRGGLTQVGDFARGSNLYDGDYRGFSTGTLDPRWRRHLLLPPLTTQQTNLTGRTGMLEPLFWCYVKNELYLGVAGADGSACLFKEHISWSVIEQPYRNAGDNITCLGPITIGGVASGERLFVGHQNGPPQIVDPATGNLIGGTSSMHANLVTAFGILTSPANATTPGTSSTLIYANHKIWSVPVTAAVGDAPTPVLNDLPNGGYAIGIFQLPKGPYGLRAFWAIPLTDTPGTGSLVLVWNSPVKVIHTNLEGGDPVEVDMGLPLLRFVANWQNKLVGSDATRVVTFDGEELRDLGVMNNRKANSDLKYSVTGLLVKGRDLCAAITSGDLTTLPTTAGQSKLQLEEYIAEMDAWLPASGSMPLGDISASDTANSWYAYQSNGRFHLYSPSIPWSKRSYFAYFHMCKASAWDWLYQPPSRANPFYTVRQTGAARQGTQDFEQQGYLDLPAWELPQLEGRWKKADQVVFMGDADAGGSGAQVGISINGNSPINFYAGMLDGNRVVQTSDTGDDGLWMQLQLRITANRGATTTQTVNCLPMMVRGRAYLTDPTTQVLGLPPGP